MRKLEVDFNGIFTEEEIKDRILFFAALETLEAISDHYLGSESKNPAGLGAAVILSIIKEEMLKDNPRSAFLNDLKDWMKEKVRTNDLEDYILINKQVGGEC